MSENYIKKAFVFLLAIVLIFTAISFVGEKFDFGNWGLKPVNLFADVVNETEQNPFTELSYDDLAHVSTNTPSEKPHATDTTTHNTQEVYIPDSIRFNTQAVQLGIVPIINFSNNYHPLDGLITRMLKAKKGQAKVRIAWYGDSFTDADIMVSDLRDTLQTVFGGNGVGFVPITSEAPGYRRSVVHSFGGWNTKSVIHHARSGNFGINGFVYRPDSANYLRYAATKSFKNTRKFDLLKLFYKANRDIDTRIVINDTLKMKQTLPQQSKPGMVSVSHKNIAKLKINFPHTSGVDIYGASLEDSTGVYIDNFSIKGNSGIGLMAIPNEYLAAFDSMLNYDLIVLQFGLNAITAETRDFSGYMRNMTRLIAKLRASFGDTPILVLSVSDRSERRQGNYVTMQSIKGLVAAQQKMAADNKVLFWNLYEAMGGENSMVAFVDAKPPLANKDYTHLNFLGGKRIASVFAKSLFVEVQNYEERRKNIVENH